MAKVTLDEQTTPASPGAGKGVVYVKDDTPSVLKFVDDAGTDHSLTSGLSRASSLGAAPSSFTFKVLDGGAGVADILYASMELSDDTWNWVEVVRAP